MVLIISPWTPYDLTIGQPGSENGTIVRDEEHEAGARITLEKDGATAPFSITCGIAGWMVHTRFFASQEEATNEYDLMKAALETILEVIPLVDDPQVNNKMRQVCDAIDKFVGEFP